MKIKLNSLYGKNAQVSMDDFEIMEHYQIQLSDVQLVRYAAESLEVSVDKVLQTPYVGLIRMLCDKIEAEKAKREMSENIISTIDKFLNQERGY